LAPVNHFWLKLGLLRCKVANLNSIFYSESVEERWPFTPDLAEALAMACCPSKAASPWFQNAKSLIA
jgi:hypothetical protein